MERLTYMLVIGLSCCFCFLGLIIPTNSTQSGLGPQISQQLQDERGHIRDVDALSSIQKRAATKKTPAVSTIKTPTTTAPNDTIKTSKSGDSGQKGSGKDGTSYISGFASPDSLKRMLVVLLSITAIAVVYFIFRTLRLRKNRKTRKYGVLTTNSDHLEMAPLDQEEEDEDMTVFEASSRYKW